MVTTVAMSMILARTTAETRLTTNERPYILPAPFCISASLALSFGSNPMRTIQGVAKRMGEYQTNPITMVATADTNTAQKLMPANESAPIIVSSCGKAGCKVSRFQSFKVVLNRMGIRGTLKLCNLGFLPASIHSLVREPVGRLIVFAQGVANFKVLELPNQLLRLLIQLAQFRMTHLVDAFHLPHHQLGIANHLERLDPMFFSVS